MELGSLMTTGDHNWPHLFSRCDLIPLIVKKYIELPRENQSVTWSHTISKKIFTKRKMAFKLCKYQEIKFTTSAMYQISREK